MAFKGGCMVGHDVDWSDVGSAGNWQGRASKRSRQKTNENARKGAVANVCGVTA